MSVRVEPSASRVSSASWMVSSPFKKPITLGRPASAWMEDRFSRRKVSTWAAARAPPLCSDCTAFSARICFVYRTDGIPMISDGTITASR